MITSQLTLPQNSRPATAQAAKTLCAKRQAKKSRRARCAWASGLSSKTVAAGRGAIGEFNLAHSASRRFLASTDVGNRNRGCVSGEQVTNMQNKIGKGSDGEYQWDMLDGWEELE